jgi:hypothetical protein
MVTGAVVTTEGVELLAAAWTATAGDTPLPASVVPSAANRSKRTVAVVVAALPTAALSSVAVALTEAVVALTPSAGLAVDEGVVMIALGLTVLVAWIPSVSMWTGGAL